MNYIALSFIAAGCFALNQIISKLMSKHGIDNPNSLMAYFLLASLAFGICLGPFVAFALPPLTLLPLVVSFVLLFLIGNYCFFTGIFKADASSFAPLFQLQAALVGLLAFLFLGERFSAQNYVWMGLLLLGAMLVSFNENMTIKSFFSRSILLILLMQVFHASSNLLVGLTLKGATPLQIIFWENIGIGLAFPLFYFWKKPKLQYPLAEISPMFLTTFITGLGVIALFSAFAVNLTISSVIGLLSAPLVFVISLIASRVSPQLLEHHTAKVYAVRAVGLGIILLGALKITLG